MSIHAQAQQVESLLFPKGRTADDGVWYGSGQRALQIAPRNEVGRPGKTDRDRRSGAWGNRFANRQNRVARPGAGKSR